MALANCLDKVIIGENVLELSTFEFTGKFVPDGFGHLKHFWQDAGVHFKYETEAFELAKSVYLLRDADTVALVYDFKRLAQPVELAVRPFVALRDFHGLQRSYAHLCSEWKEDHLVVSHETPASCRLLLSCPGSDFEKDPQWWFDFVYRVDRERGQDHAEDLWAPGFFKIRADSPRHIVLWASLTPSRCPQNPAQLVNLDIEMVLKNLVAHRTELTAATQRPDDENVATLSVAADQFVVRREGIEKSSTTILAGYPWFADWGRDAFISLPGLLLDTGRHQEARSVLTTFAEVANEGMIPNHFDDRSDTAHYNSVDAPLWFINAAFRYLWTAKETEYFCERLLPTIQSIIHCYQNGTRFGIRGDDDGLITAGDSGTQLTWMDAKCGGVTFTPRHGKAVEVNALWYNALRLTADFFRERNADSYNWYTDMANVAGESFCRLFWNDEFKFLNDCIGPDGSYDASLRPNQIFAVSLPHSPLEAEQQRSVVEVVEHNLLTPFGLRTLSPEDSRYKGRYCGPQQERDAAYHQGTVWPYLMGAFVEAYLKVNEFSDDSKQKAREFIQPLLWHMRENGCLGSVSEVFDGDEPQGPKGCFAQAWSVAELLRAYLLING
jgi:predicted glycogen debranching enzyme